MVDLIIDYKSYKITEKRFKKSKQLIPTEEMGKSKKFTCNMAPDPDYFTRKLYHIFKIQFMLY